MTNNPTIDGVSREIPLELLRRLSKNYTGRPNWDALEDDRLEAVEELRALLDAPAAERQEVTASQNFELVAYHVTDEHGQKKVLLPGAYGINRHKERGAVMRELVDRACIAELQGEINALTAGWYKDDSGNLKFWPEEISALQSTIAQLKDEVGAAKGEYDRSANKVAQLQARVQELESGRGEPVMKLEAERLWGGAGEYAVSVVKSGWLDECRKIGGEFLLYAAPPALVAVVLPERRTPEHYHARIGKCGAADMLAEEWNACLGATAALNGPAQ